MNLDWAAIGSVGTAVAVLIAAWQVRKNTQQARIDFEDMLSREYREVTRSIPVEANLGHRIREEELEQALQRLYQYIDLTNEQVFLRKNGRISKTTWLNWVDGIKTNLGKPAFHKAWERIKRDLDGEFTELRQLERSGFIGDPRSWIPAWKRMWFFSRICG